MTESRGDYSLLTTVSIMVLAAVAIAFALQYTRPVMVPFVLAIFISYLVSPVVDFLRVQLRLPRVAAVAIALLVAAGLPGHRSRRCPPAISSGPRSMTIWRQDGTGRWDGPRSALASATSCRHRPNAICVPTPDGSSSTV